MLTFSFPSNRVMTSQQYELKFPVAYYVSEWWVTICNYHLGSFPTSFRIETLHLIFFILFFFLKFLCLHARLRLHPVAGRHRAKTQRRNNVFWTPPCISDGRCCVRIRPVRLQVEFVRFPTPRCACTVSSTSRLDASAGRRPECKSTSTCTDILLFCLIRNKNHNIPFVCVPQTQAN